MSKYFTLPKNKNLAFILAFLIPVFILSGIYIIRDIYPFGEACFLRTDMYHQYAPFFSEFYNKLHNNGSLTYSWNIGMGTNFTALYAYYLASPANWFVFFAPKDHIIEFMSILIILKLALSSLNFAIYLSRHFKTRSIEIVFFSIFYSLSGYVAAYSWNIMWLDCILLLPFILLGLEMLVNENKCFLYCISLGFCILSNYYISIMICIFLVFYFLGLLILLPENTSFKNYAKKIFNFGIFSLIAGGFAAFLIIPEFCALQSTASGDINFPKTLSTYYTLFDIMVKHLMNLETSVLSGNYPNIYCGVFIFVLFPLYIMNNSIKPKEKIVKITLLAILLISFNMNITTFIWHGFHYPNSLPCRQSFIYIFLILVLAFEAFRDIKYYSRAQICGVFWGAIAFILLAEKLPDGDNKLPVYVIYVSLLFICIYMLLMYFYRSDKIIKNGILFLMFAVTITEATINTGQTSISTTSRTYYMNDFYNIEELTDRILTEDTDFYRIEKNSRRTKNDTAWHYLRGISTFSSTANAPLTELLGNLGFEHSTNAYSFNGYTPFTASILNVKYMIEKELFEDSEITSLYTSKDTTYIYKNNYTLPLGFMVDDSMITWRASSQSNPLKAQNSFARTAAGTGDIFTPVKFTVKGDTATLNNTKTQHLYVWISSSSVKKVTVTFGSEKTKTFDDLNHKYIIDLGICQAGENITISTEDVSTLNLSAYSFNEDKFIDAYNTLSSQPFIVSSFDDTNIIGTINVSEEGLMFTSIPYDKGWKVWVDYEEVEPIAFNDALIALNLTEGTHIIKFSYEPEGLRMGTIITLSSIGLFLMIAIVDSFMKYFRKKHNLR